jgi:hypothetical protein
MGRSKTRSNRHRQRRLGRRAAPAAVPPVAHATPPTVIDQTLALPALDRLLGWLLDRPRALQVAGVLVGIFLAVLALRPLLLSAAPVSLAAIKVAPTQAAATASPPAAPAGSAEQAVIDLIAAYNQASITAAVLGRADAMAPYLAPDGIAWADAQAEYGRRATRGETHNPALTRWGILRVVVDSDAATVETQEQWDDQTSVGGQVVSSRRGILTQNIYELRRVPSTERWLITTVTTTNIID